VTRERLVLKPRGNQKGRTDRGGPKPSLGGSK
jgi:hypothetical protein